MTIGLDDKNATHCLNIFKKLNIYINLYICEHIQNLNVNKLHIINNKEILILISSSNNVE